MFGFKFMSLLNHVKLFLDFIGCHLCLLHKWLINLLSVICWVSLQISGFIPLNWLSMLLGDKINIDKTRVPVLNYDLKALFEQLAEKQDTSMIVYHCRTNADSNGPG